MKLIFNSITLGGGPPYFLDGKMKGLSGDLLNVNIKIPRTDYSMNVADYLNPKARTFTGKIVGSDTTDFRNKKRALVNMIRETFTFQLVDDVKNADGSITTFATYQFTGKIVDFDANINHRSNMSDFSMMIVSEDPFLYLLPGTDQFLTIKPRGFIFPLIFQFVFAGRDNSFDFINPGAVASYPTITIKGPATNIEIISQNSPLTNKTFLYNGSLVQGDTLIITPNPNDPVKVRKNGVSAIQLTNANFDALAVQPGENVFTFFADNVLDGVSGVEFVYYPAFIGI